jgi:hypothetical protein
MIKAKYVFFIGLSIVFLLSCDLQYSSYTVSFPKSENSKNEKLRSNSFVTIDGSRVFYSEGKEFWGGYSDYSYGTNISGVGTIKVLVKAVSENNFESFGFEYRNSGATPSEEISFNIKLNGTYSVYWFDGTNSSSSMTWTSSSYIKTGLNEWNELRIDYNTSNKTFSFYINNSPKLLEKTFNYIRAGTVSYYTSLNNANTTFPYRIEFKTISPYSYP